MEKKIWNENIGQETKRDSLKKKSRRQHKIQRYCGIGILLYYSGQRITPELLTPLKESKRLNLKGIHQTMTGEIEFSALSPQNLLSVKPD